MLQRNKVQPWRRRLELKSSWRSSAKTGENVEDAFLSLVKDILTSCRQKIADNV